MNSVRVIITFFIILLCTAMSTGYAQNSANHPTSPPASPQLQKPRVAIANPIVGKGVSERALSHLNLSILVSEMEASIRATRKFEVLTRQKRVLKIIRKEQQFAKSNLAKGNAASEGELENANYLVIPLVQDFKFYRSTKPIPNISGKYLVKDSGLLQINTQVVDTSSGQIKATFYLKSGFSTKPRVANRSGGTPSTVYFTRMAKKVSAQLANQLIDTVFPMLILAVNGKQVWINRGSDGGIKNGEVLKIYKPGEELIDPYTHEKLGSAEAYVGKVKVVTVNPKFTIAKIISANNETIMPGFIVRRR